MMLFGNIKKIIYEGMGEEAEEYGKGEGKGRGRGRGVKGDARIARKKF